MDQFTWARRGGYECSSKGDKRFSALFAVMPDGRTIEQHYQCDVKGYQPGGRNWQLGKGKPPLRTDVDLWTEYLKLWTTWAQTNQKLMLELRNAAQAHGNVLTDCFASTQVNQARALAELLNAGHGIAVQRLQPFKLIVAGGRDFTDYAKAKEEILRLGNEELKDFAVSIVSGMARGADALAVRFAREHKVKLHEFPADWERNRKRAGFDRNAQMARFADGLLAFWDGKSRGTKHMIDTARALQLAVRVIEY